MPGSSFSLLVCSPIIMGCASRLFDTIFRFFACSCWNESTFSNVFNNSSTCFDIAAKKHVLLLLKTLLNVDSFQQEQAKNLKIVSNNLDAHPMIIGLQTRREKLEPGIVYERYDL